MIIIVGHIITEPAQVHELAADLRSGIATTLTEDGCLAYSFALDDADAGTVLVLERWRDQSALDAHLATPPVASLLEKWGGRIDIAVRKFDATNERDVMVA